MKNARLRLVIRAFGKLALLSTTFLSGVLATAVFAAILDSVASSSPAQQPSPVTDSEQISSAPQAAIAQQPVGSSEPQAKDSDAWPDIPPLALSRGRTLLTWGATLHMLDANNQVLWSWSAGDNGWPFITNQPIVDSSGTVYLIGSDLTHVALGVSTGEVKWRGTASGRAGYAQIEHYKDDHYLVLVDMSGYDDASEYRPENELRAYQGQDLIWSIDFPRDAKLTVLMERIYAVVYNKDGLEVREIPPPDEEFSCAC